MKKNLYLIILITSFSCTKFYEMDIPEDKKCLVFEGVYTNQKLPSYFILSKTTKYKFRHDSARYAYEKGARLIISDDNGNTDTLKEYYDGRYSSHPNKMQGKVGNSYKIDIYTKDGKHYVSSVEKMHSVPKIDSIYYKRDKNNRLKTDSNAYLNTVYADWQDPKDTINLIMNYVTYYWDERWQDNFRWSNIINDFNFDGRYMKKIVLFNDYANLSYKMRITFYSLTRQNYDYWNVLYQQKNPGEDADVNASVPLIGNIYNVNDSKDYVLGYFQVSAAYVKEVDVVQ